MMEPRRRHCIGDCDFAGYYRSQVGSGLNDISVFRGRPYQRGYGYGALFRHIGIPLLKFIGKHLFPAGVALGGDLMDNQPFKESFRKRGAEFVRNAGNDGVRRLATYLSMRGSGRIYKRKKKAKTKTAKPKRCKVVRRKRSRDIFNGLSA